MSNCFWVVVCFRISWAKIIESKWLKAHCYYYKRSGKITAERKISTATIDMNDKQENKTRFCNNKSIEISSSWILIIQKYNFPREKLHFAWKTAKTTLLGQKFSRIASRTTSANFQTPLILNKWKHLQHHNHSPQTHTKKKRNSWIICKVCLSGKLKKKTITKLYRKKCFMWIYLFTNSLKIVFWLCHIKVDWVKRYLEDFVLWIHWNHFHWISFELKFW